MNTMRLVATFPLNGDQYEGYIVHLIDENLSSERYRVRDIAGRYYVERNYPTFVEALELCLRNSGWGEHTIKSIYNEDGS